MASAILQAETRARGLDHARFPHYRPLSVRQDVRLALEAQALPGWQIGGDPRKMGQLLLLDDQTGMTVRFLKAPYSQPDRVPHAGSNAARRNTWSQKPLPTMGTPCLLSTVGSLSRTYFLLIWAYLDAAVRTDGYDLRIVHPREPGRFGAATLCDLDLTIPRGGNLGEKDLRFTASDDDEDLFSFGLSDVEEDEGGA